MAIAVEQWLELNRIRDVNRKMWEKLHPVLVRGEFDKAQSIIDEDQSTISQMLGLLGTIMGLIEAFTAVSNANPTEKADLLSASISVTMNTTAFGLMSAIPLLLFHAKLTSTTKQKMERNEKQGMLAIALVAGARVPPGKEAAKRKVGINSRKAFPNSLPSPLPNIGPVSLILGLSSFACGICTRCS